MYTLGIHAHANAQTHAHTYTHIHAHARTHTRAHTHANTHAQCSRSFLSVRVWSRPVLASLPMPYGWSWETHLSISQEIRPSTQSHRYHQAKHTC